METEREGRRQRGREGDREGKRQRGREKNKKFETCQIGALSEKPLRSGVKRLHAESYLIKP